MMLSIYFDRRLLCLLFLGFSSGIPFLLTLSTLSFRLSEGGIHASVIGLLATTTLPYSLKFLWAPLLDHFASHWCKNKTKGIKIWGVISQICVIFSTIIIGKISIEHHLWATAIFSFLLSFFAASQDIAIDTLRIEFFMHNKGTVSAAIESIGFRLGTFISGAGALYIASVYDWELAYYVMAFMQALSVPSFLFFPIKAVVNHLQNETVTWKQTLKQSLLELWNKTPLVKLVTLIFFFKIADYALNAMSAPFLYDLGFTKIEYANITKTLGIFLMIVGSLLAGYVTHAIGLYKTALISIFLQALSCISFYIQTFFGKNIGVLIINVGIESFASGMTSTIFIASLSLFCSLKFSATHFSVLYAVGSLSRVVISVLAGYIADIFGWPILFLFSTFLCFPAFYLLIHLKPYFNINSLRTQDSNKNDKTKCTSVAIGASSS